MAWQVTLLKAKTFVQLEHTILILSEMNSNLVSQASLCGRSSLLRLRV
jgi:hypothetical protein